MNVFGQSERSWRKARKRAVSPIIATILLVAITVVLAAVLYVLISGLTHGTGGTPIGSAFTAGNPILTQQGATAGTGCAVHDYCYTLTIESSSVTFGSVQFEVKSSGGSVYTANTAGGFAILNVAGKGVAYSNVTAAGLAMSSGFSLFFEGATSSSPLTSTYTIVIDLGQGATNPSGTGLTFVTLGIGAYSGTTSTALP